MRVFIRLLLCFGLNSSFGVVGQIATDDYRRAVSEDATFASTQKAARVFAEIPGRFSDMGSLNGDTFGNLDFVCLGGTEQYPDLFFGTGFAKFFNKIKGIIDRYFLPAKDIDSGSSALNACHEDGFSWEMQPCNFFALDFIKYQCSRFSESTEGTTDDSILRGVVADISCWTIENLLFESNMLEAIFGCIDYHKNNTSGYMSCRNIIRPGLSLALINLTHDPSAGMVKGIPIDGVAESQIIRRTLLRVFDVVNVNNIVGYLDELSLSYDSCLKIIALSYLGQKTMSCIKNHTNLEPQTLDSSDIAD